MGKGQGLPALLVVVPFHALLFCAVTVKPPCACTVLSRDGWVPLGLHDDDGSLGPACRVSPLGSTWLSMCGSSTCDPLIGSHTRGCVEMSHIDCINDKIRV
ncbi:hypothetical protein DVH24_027691 [Malus domestica]|uniref:Secreted protein n=1 Tax=Malus domestica TaxID=3750 RepID=A0A498HBC3_MALDO|nr:hypothetical protein DVH24_027691 [Malus domestica]